MFAPRRGERLIVFMMKPNEMAEWIELGIRLQAAAPEKREQVVERLRSVVEAQEFISSWQLWMAPRRPGFA